MAASLQALGDRKLSLLRELLELSRRQLLLVNLDELAPLLEQKETLIARVREVDRAVGEQAAGAGGEPKPPPWQAAVNGLVEAILQNERTMEARLEEEQGAVKRELQTLERQGRLRQYLEGSRAPGRSLNMKR